MQRKARGKIISSKLRASDQALAEGQSTKVNCQELAREYRDRSTRDANENSERRERNGPSGGQQAEKTRGNSERVVKTPLFIGLRVAVMLKEHG